MSLKSVYLPEPLIEKNRIHVTDDEHRHLTVARATSGEPVDVFDGRGNVWRATVVEVHRHETVVEVRESRYVEPDSVHVALGLALIRMAAFELALEKAVEVGVNRVIPFLAERSNVAHPKSRDRLNRILIEAAKQSKRYRLPVLEDPVSFDQIVSTSASSKIMFAEHQGGPLKSALFGSPVLYLVGPEGGWTEEEMRIAGQRGFHPVSLGAGILRAETAAVVGGAIIRYELGWT
jgi:16S rRNA (uracil1498-N3)-methyltransferase